LHYLAYTAPHYPLHAKPEDIARYKGKYAAGWEALRQQRLAKQKQLGLIDERWHVEVRDSLSPEWGKAKAIDEDWQQLRMEVYVAMIDSVDQNVGRVLDLLDELGIADNTLVLFLSDNGGCAETPGGNDPKQVPGPKEFYSHVGPGWATASNTPWRRYKSYCHEGGISTPLLARWPSVIKAGTRTDQVGHIIDFLPTFLDVAEAAYPEKHPEFREKTLPLEGRTLLPVLKGEERQPHKELFWHWAGNRAVRAGDWKLVWGRREKSWALYDMVNDRTEAQDLAPENPQLVSTLSGKWEGWAAMTGVKYKK